MAFYPDEQNIFKTYPNFFNDKIETSESAQSKIKRKAA